MASVFTVIKQAGLTIFGKSGSSTASVVGSLEVLTSTNKLYYYNGIISDPVVTETTTATLTNKSMSGLSNTFTNIPNSATTGTSSNTPSTLVERDGSGNFAAGTITASLTGNVTGNVTGTASGNTTYTPNQYGVVLSGSTNAMSVLTPDSESVYPLVSGGASANPSWSLLSVPGGGTGVSSFTANQVILGGTSSTSPLAQVAGGTSGYVLTSTGTSSAPTWQVNSNGGYPNWSFNNQTGTTYTLALTDEASNGVWLTTNNSSGTIITIPTHASVAFPVGALINITQLGTGVASFSPAGGVTLNGLSGATSLIGAYASGYIIQTATDVWNLNGQIASPISAMGGTITTVGNYKVHTFNSSGTFTITSGQGQLEILAVGGGGAGNGSSFPNGYGGAGGGGGQVIDMTPSQTYTPNAYTVTVGLRGNFGNPNGATSGGNSIFDATDLINTVTALGGNHAIDNLVNMSIGAAAQSPPGGAGGGNSNAPNGNPGGTGSASSITGSSVTYGGGGGGGASGAGGLGGSGGSGGGAAGGNSDGQNGQNGTTNLGGGGGGGAWNSGGGNTNGGYGGDGVVIVKYRFQ